MKRRILLVDDHEPLRRVIKRMLARRFTICGECSNGEQAVVKAVALRPDLVLLDVNMPVLNGIEAARQIRSVSPATKILLLSGNDPSRLALQAKEAGADGFLSKTAAADKLIDAIDRLIGAGERLAVGGT